MYRRDFAHGAVLVNPSATSATVALGSQMMQASATGGGVVAATDLDAQGNYTGGTLTFQPVSTVTLAPLSAALLLAQ